MKRFTLKSLLYSVPIIIPIIIFVFFINPYLLGDIGPLGYVTFPKNYGKYTLKEKNKMINCGYNYSALNDSCILTIGDSFSEGISYNYFLNLKTDYNVVNLAKQVHTVSPFTRFLYLSKTQNLPRIVIVETVERHLVERLCELSVSSSTELMIAKNGIDTLIISNKKSKQKTILEKTQEWAKRKIGYKNPIEFSMLNKECFTCKGKEKSLYFYYEDINKIPQKEGSLNKAIMNLDSLFTYAESIGVELYVLVAADKYDIYQDYIIDNPYPKQDLLERLSIVYPHSKIINSKDTLSKMVAKGVLDVYWCNNTHWSPMGAEAVADMIVEKINRCEKDTIFLYSR